MEKLTFFTLTFHLIEREGITGQMIEVTQEKILHFVLFDRRLKVKTLE